MNGHVIVLLRLSTAASLFLVWAHFAPGYVYSQVTPLYPLFVLESLFHAFIYLSSLLNVGPEIQSLIYTRVPNLQKDFDSTYEAYEQSTHAGLESLMKGLYNWKVRVILDQTIADYCSYM